MDPEAMDPKAMDHCAMGHLPPEQCPPKEAPEPDHSAMDHSAMDHGSMDHGSMDHSAMGHGSTSPPSADHSVHSAHAGHTMSDKSAPGAAPETAVPPQALTGPRHAADAIWGAEAMAAARKANHEGHGAMTTGMVLVERLEARLGGGHDGWLWDAQGWYGGDIDKFTLKTEGEGEFGGALEQAELQALWSHAIGPYWDVQAGLRLDLEPESRTHLALGVQGLAPYMFHVDAAAFLSDRGDLTARVKAEYDQKLTQRLILQPRVEAKLAAQAIAERETGAGLTKIETGLRLRYEIQREFAPYIGVGYEAKTGETARIARAKGEDPDGFRALIGIRAWF